MPTHNAVLIHAPHFVCGKTSSEILLRYRKDAERREKLALKSANPPNKTGHYLAGASASSSAPAASARRHSKSSVEDKGYSARK